MSFTSDLNLVDMFFNHDDQFSLLNSDDSFKSKENQKDPEMDWLSDNFLDSILKPNCYSSPLILPDKDIFPNKLPENIETEKCVAQNKFNNDDPSFSTDRKIAGEASILSNCVHFGNDILNELNAENGFTMELGINECKETNDSSNESVNINEEVVECEEISLLSDNMVVTDVIWDTSDYCKDDKGNNIEELFMSDLNGEDEYLDKSDSSNNKPFLLKNSPRFKTVKLVGFRHPGKHIFSPRRNHSTHNTDEVASDDSDSVFPKLNLSAEEVKLMTREGITLPTHYPLTKSEEKDLKRIRRKIRNKISAQDSRRRKKAYVDGLEERLKRSTVENTQLLNCVNRLKKQNMALESQVRKLQAFVGKHLTQPTTQPATSLLVLFLSLALVLAPALRNNTSLKNGVSEDEGISLSDGENSVVSSRSRNLLYAETGSLDDLCSNVGDGAKIMEDASKQEFDFCKLDVLTILRPSEKAEDNTVRREHHDYFHPRKRPASSDSSDSNDSWSTPPHSPNLRKSNDLQPIDQRVDDRVNDTHDGIYTRYFNNKY